jgi:hypothetical protein
VIHRHAINGNEEIMTTFTINSDNSIIAFASPDHAEKSIGEGAQPFTTQARLGKLSADWPMSRFVDTWNRMAGAVPFDDLRPVKKFENRAKAVARIWQSVQRLAPGAQPGAQDAAPVPAATEGATRKSKAKRTIRSATVVAKCKCTVREGSKAAIIMSLIAKGATLHELMTVAGWQAHSVRGFLSTAGKKYGINIESTRDKAGERFYKIDN